MSDWKRQIVIGNERLDESLAKADKTLKEAERTIRESQAFRKKVHEDLQQMHLYRCRINEILGKFYDLYAHSFT